jgi:hypothetical protein
MTVALGGSGRYEAVAGYRDANTSIGTAAWYFADVYQTKKFSYSLHGYWAKL